MFENRLGLWCFCKSSLKEMKVIGETKGYRVILGPPVSYLYVNIFVIFERMQYLPKRDFF